VKAWAGVFVVGLAASVLWAEAGDHLDAKFEYFRDRNDVTALSPVISLSKSVADHLSVEWEGQLDAVTGASRQWGTQGSGQNPPVDVVSGASGSSSTVSHVLDGITGASGNGNWEYRAGGRLGFSWSDKGRSLSGGLYASQESDYKSFSPSVAGSWDFNERNTTVSGSASWFFDRMSPFGAWGQIGGGSKHVQSYSAGVSQILTPLLLVGVNATFTRTTGYIGHPYNPVSTSDSGMIAENLPGTKDAVALAGQAIQGFKVLGLLGSLDAEYRRYADSWGLNSNTITLRASQHVSDATVVRIQARWYQQGRAEFVKDSYVGTELYRTADIRFFPFNSYLLGAKISSEFPEDWDGWLPRRWDLSYDHLWRDTPGNPLLYQFYPSSAWYMQGTGRVGLSWDL